MITALGFVQVFAVYIGMLLIGRGCVFVLSFGRHASNPIYQLFVIVTNPIVRLVRFITPAAVADKHLPWVAFFLLFWLYVSLAIAIPMLLKM